MTIRNFTAFFALSFFVLIVTLHGLHPATAQSNNSVSTNSPVSQTSSEAEIDPATWNGVLDSADQALSREGLTDRDLDKLLRETQRVEREAQIQISNEQDQLDLLRQRLDSLGPAPKDGEPAESQEAQEQRTAITGQFAELDAKIKRASDAELRAKQLRERIANRRHEQFFSEIRQRTPGIFQPEFWSKFSSGFSGFTRSFQILVSDSTSVFVKSLNESKYKILVLAFFIPLALLAFVRGRRMMQNIRQRVPEHTSTKAVAGFAYYVQSGILPAALVVALYQIFSLPGLLTPRLDQLLSSIVIALSFYIVILCLLRVVVAPFEPDRRIIAVSDTMAVKGYRIASYGLLVALLLSILNSAAVVFVMPLQVKVGLSLIHCIVIGVLTLWILVLYRRDYLQQKMLQGSRSLPRFWRVLIVALWVIGIVILLLALIGFVSFAEFLSHQLLFGLVVIISAWLLLRFVDFLFLQWSATEDTEAAVSASSGANAASAGQFAILASGVSKLSIYVIAAMLLMLPWGYRTRDFFQLFEQAFFGFEVGGLSFSISTILLVIGLFFIGYTVTVALRSWLQEKLLPTTSLDIGISNSISTVFGYVGIVIAAMLAVSAAGFDLSNLAIVAGALSVGVGFGLQSIVNNFVSGLILLAERPIKVGDWIVTSGGAGYVKKISVRSTEIETFDRAAVIIPNSTLITDNVTNWTHGNKTGRIIVPIGVAYESDPEEVKEILLECARNHRMVLGRPEPVVYFMEFGASSLDFELRCFLADINYMLTVQSELRFEILAKLREANIGIPFPQREVLIKTEEQPKLVTQAKPRAKRKPQAKT